ncbi:branched-chain amino acid ABC transporter permease [Microbacterium sp.]|uniref:branched-chain amino acid ABC transporter permease n=1 Tax=Microbacterium sp. TaxID=51671 RepID=UPI003F9A649D
MTQVRARERKSRDRFAPDRQRRIRWDIIIPVAILVIAIAFPFVVDRPRFWIPNIGVKTMWLGTIAMSMVFLNRYLGLLSLAQVTIAGVAAYGVGYFAVTSGWPDSAAMIVAVVIGTAFGAIIALISVRTRAIYFLMITLAIGQVFYSWASQDAAITGARRGIAPIARDEFGPLDFRNLTTFYLAALLIAVVCYLLCRWVGATPFGYALQGIRDSPERMQALGYRIGMYRIGAVTFVSFIASLGGIIMVFDRAQADPDLVSLGSTLDVLVVAVIGGIGSLGGAFIGALLFSLLDSFAQDLTDRYMTLTGVIFIAILYFAPSGLAGGWKQISTSVQRRMRRRNETEDAEPAQDPDPAPEGAADSADSAITKGTKQ